MFVWQHIAKAECNSSKSHLHQIDNNVISKTLIYYTQ